VKNIQTQPLTFQQAILFHRDRILAQALDIKIGTIGLLLAADETRPNNNLGWRTQLSGAQQHDENEAG
jgi:hypothetical protein